MNLFLLQNSWLKLKVFPVKKPRTVLLVLSFILSGHISAFSHEMVPSLGGVPVKIDTAHKAADTSKIQLLTDSIISITNLSSQKEKDSARINEIIAVRLSTSKPVGTFNTLYINGIKVKGLKPWDVNENYKTVSFKLDKNVQDLVVQFLQSQAIDKAVIPVFISVGDSSKYVINGTASVELQVNQKISRAWVVVIAILIIVILVTALTQNVLKDDNNLYYSLSRTQLLYWTILFAVAYLYICAYTGTMPDIPGSLLAIMGITASTMAATKVIENSHKAVVPIDPSAKSEGFFLDILSDGSSINIQRFQNVIFNLLFGIIFIQKTWSTALMPDFDNNVLLLLGISAGTYAGLKVTEATKEQNKPAPQVNSDDQSTDIEKVK